MVANVFKFKSYYDQMNFSPEQRLAITKVIIDLTDPSGSLGLAENRSRGGNEFRYNAMVFYDKGRPSQSP